MTLDDLARIRAYYDRCLLIARRGSLPLLRSTFTETTDWLQRVGSATEAREDSRWVSLRAVAAALGAMTASVPASVRGLISEWYGAVVGRINVKLSSERFDEDQDDLTAAQAAALRSLLDAASAAVATGGRLQVAVYRQDNSAHVAVSADSADLRSALAELARLLDECISYVDCAQIEQGWLIKVRYMRPITSATLADVGRSVQAAADERKDLLPLARQIADLVNLVETVYAQGDAAMDYQIHAAELSGQRGMI